MTTATEYRTEAQAHRDEAAASWERSDTDGFVSQWASGLSADKAEANAVLADNGGKTITRALFLLDGRVASTHQAQGQWGSYWVLNDEAAAVIGKRFVTTSSASKGAARIKNNAKKGFSVGSIEVAGYVTIAGSGTGLSGAVSCRVVTLPVVAALVAGEYTVVATVNEESDY